MAVVTSRGLHLGVIHSQGEVVRSLAQVLSSLPGEDILNKRNHLYQVTDLLLGDDPPSLDSLKYM